MKRHIILISLFLFTALFSVAQNSGCTIKGVVREYDLDMQKNPLDGVQVQIAVDGNRSDITKDGGKFAIEDVPYCHPGDKISTDKNSFTKPGYELFYPDALNFWYVPNVTINSSTEILMCKSSRINQVRQKLFNVVDQYHKKLYEQKKDELEKAHLEKGDMERQLIILEAQFRDTAQIMKMVNEWLYLDRLKCDSVLKQAYAFMENGEVDKAREIMNKHEMKSSDYYKKRMNEVMDEVTLALQFVKRRLNMNFASNGEDVITFIERDCNFLIDIYTGQLNVDDPEGFINKKQIKKQLAAAYALKGDISEISYSEADVKEFISNYRKAAEMGNAHAQYKIGECYENVLRAKWGYHYTEYMFNIDSARYWYASAAYQNDTNAIRRLETFYDFVAKDKNGNDIYYHILPDRKSVSVVQKTLNTQVYSENIILPKKVKYDNMQFTVTTIGEDAFRGCKSLESVT
ncbi:MAG: hypothetical protein KBS95_05275, partial [Alistipes sp.]|nr:hypothetical protein [Candidatus Alistipes equi]